MSIHYWHGGQPTEACIEAYTMGDCWILAIHLARQTGWTVYLVEDGAHWVVKDPAGDRYLDVFGIQTRSAVLHRWEAKSLRKCSETLLEYAQTDVDEGQIEDYEGSHVRAPGIAKRLIEKHDVFDRGQPELF